MAILKIEDVSNPSDPGVKVLTLEGEIDIDTVPRLRARLEELERAGVTRLVLDMEKTTYVNSSALAVLVKFAESFRGAGGGVALARVSSRVRLPFEMLGLLQFFEFYDSSDAARESLAG